MGEAPTPPGHERRSTAVAAVASSAASAERDLARTLYVTHGERVFRFCRGRLRSREEAEDAAQTTFLYAFRALSRGVVPESETAWLLKIAENVCLSRSAAGRRRSALEVVHDPATIEETVASHEASVDALVPLEEALAGLTDGQRRAIVLREWHGLSYREIAAALELSEGAAEMLVSRARTALAARLGGEEPCGRRARVVEPGSLLAALKALVGGGGAAKAVAAAAVLATVSTLTASAPETSRARTVVAPAPRPAAATVPPAADSAPQPEASAERERPSAARPAEANPQERREARPVQPEPPRAAAAPETASLAPAAKSRDELPPPSTADAPAPAPAPAATEDSVQAVADAVEPVVETVETVADQVVDEVESTAGAVVATAEETVSEPVEQTVELAKPVVDTVESVVTVEPALP